ncbi:MAG: PmoA family protein [Isosphaeraceae bacterium]
MRVWTGWCLACLLVALSALRTEAADLPLVEVQAGDHDRDGTPVFVELPEPVSTPLIVEDLTTGQRASAQLLPGSRQSLVWIVNGLPARTRRRYRVVPLVAVSAIDPLMMRVVERSGRLDLERKGAVALSYAISTLDPPAGLDPVYRRSGFIHPLKTPAGRVVTDDFPVDHAHQHGLFFAWVNTTFDGRKVDFWNQPAKQGRVRHVELVETAGGPVFTEFSARLRHEATPGDGQPIPALDETWTVRLYNIPGRHVIDFRSSQTCAGSRPLEINTYHYGGFGFRGTRAWFDDQVKGEAPPDPARSGDSQFLTSEGKHRNDGNHTRPRWLDLSGRVDGAMAGVTVLDSPTNFRFPQPVRIHPNKPYFAFSPMVQGGFRIEPGKPYVSSYRLDIHDGPPNVPMIERLWHDYADPPRVELVAEPRRPLQLQPLQRTP